MANVTYLYVLVSGGIFRDTFTKIKRVPEILYPSINSRLFDKLLGQGDTGNLNIPQCEHLFVSINRFEPKKNIGLVIRAMSRSSLQIAVKQNVHLSQYEH
jgi:alpha-1,3/alpha-1,6-mannosyltransferase